MSYLLIAKYGLIAVLVAFLTWATIDRFALAKVVAQEKRCVAAAKTSDKPLSDCAQAVTDRVTDARRAADCETALKVTNLYDIHAACGEQVKLLQAKADAAIADAADLNQQLTQAGADRDVAVQRAEARAITNADRNATNARTIDAAPRQPDGHVHCDADCVRALAGD